MIYDVKYTTNEECKKLAYSMGVPSHIAHGIAAWVFDAQPPGGFLASVYADCLFSSVCMADDESLYALLDIVRFVHNECPSQCHGRPEVFHSWQGIHADIPQEVAK